MTDAISAHNYFQLSRLSPWHVESEAINRALSMVIDAQANLPMVQIWGGGATAPSDGQFFPAARQDRRSKSNTPIPVASPTMSLR